MLVKLGVGFNKINLRCAKNDLRFFFILMDLLCTDNIKKENRKLLTCISNTILIKSLEFSIPNSIEPPNQVIKQYCKL